jgi:hypothetical protein
VTSVIFIAASSGSASPHQIAIPPGATRLISRHAIARRVDREARRGGHRLGLVAAPTLAQQAGPTGRFPLPLDPLRPADTGKPRILTPAPPLDTAGCAPLDCRLRVIGTVQHNGAVELNAVAFRW